MTSLAVLLRASPIGTAAQPSTVHGSPDDIVSPGIVAGADALGVWLDAVLGALEQAVTAERLRAIIANAKRVRGIEHFAEEVAGRALHGAALGMLDVSWELETERPVQVERFRDEELGSRFAGLPYAKAIEGFEQRLPVTRATWDRLGAIERDRAFTVAGATQDNVVRKMQHELQRQLEGGADLRDFRKAVEKRLETAGFTPQNPSHVETIFRTNVLGAYNRGRVAEMSEPDIVALFPFWQVLTANDGPPRQRSNHRAAHGWILRADDPYWASEGGPPWDFNCRCRLRSLTRKKAEAGVVHVGGELKALGLPATGFRGTTVSVPITVQPKPAQGKPAPSAPVDEPPTPPLPKGEPAPFKRPKALPRIAYETMEGGFLRPMPRQFAAPAEQPRPYTDEQRKAFGEYLAADAKALKKSPKSEAAQRAVRTKTRELLAEHGFAPAQTTARAGAVAVQKIPGAWGSFDLAGPNKGLVTLNPDTVNASARALDALAKGETVDAFALDRLRTVVHEELHAASTIKAWAFEGGAAVLEEGLTEFAARRVVNSVVASEALPALGPGSYEEFRRAIFGEVSQAYRAAKIRLTETDVLDRIHHATRQMRNGSLAAIETPAKYAQTFTQKLAGLSAKERGLLSKRLQGLKYQL